MAIRARGVEAVEALSHESSIMRIPEKCAQLRNLMLQAVARDALAALENEALDIVARETPQGPVLAPYAREKRTYREPVMMASRNGQAPDVDQILVISADNVLVRSLRLAHEATLCTQVPSVGTSRACEDVEPRKRSALLAENLN